MVKGESLGNKVYSNTASFGKLWAVIQAVIATIVGIIMIIVGAYIIKHRSDMISINGSVIEKSLCVTKMNNGETYRMCKTKIEYEIDSKKYTKEISTGTSDFEKGDDNIPIWYSPVEPGKPEYDPAPTWSGWMIIIISILVVLGSWFWVWLTRKYEVVAVAKGASGIYSMFR
jgi:hypothetical protein